MPLFLIPQIESPFGLYSVNQSLGKASVAVLKGVRISRPPLVVALMNEPSASWRALECCLHHGCLQPRCARPAGGRHRAFRPVCPIRDYWSKRCCQTGEREPSEACCHYVAKKPAGIHKKRYFECEPQRTRTSNLLIKRHEPDLLSGTDYAHLVSDIRKYSRDLRFALYLLLRSVAKFVGKMLATVLHLRRSNN